MSEIAIETPQSHDIVSVPDTREIFVTSPLQLESTTMHELHNTHETETPVNSLPPFSSSSEPNFVWGDMDGETFSCALNGIYDEMVHWNRNLFKVP